MTPVPFFLFFSFLGRETYVQQNMLPMRSETETFVVSKRIYTMDVFTSHANPKYFLFHPSHRIFRRMHVALNIGKKDN
jgi:hypothetical protein